MSRLTKQDSTGVRMDKTLFTVGEIAEQCGVRRQTLDQWMAKNEVLVPVARYAVSLGAKTIRLWTSDQVREIRKAYDR